MRRYLLMFFAACSGGSGGSLDSGPDASLFCPVSVTDGAACAPFERCWHEDTFSSCNSGFCTCEAGTVSCTRITHGAACGDEPITSCSTEGNPSCTTLPTGGGCGCIDGFWTCGCACYGATTTCEIDWCDEPVQRINGAFCTDEGRTCTELPAAGCTCTRDTGAEQATIHCAS